MPFHLWPAQARVIQTLMTQRLVIILKARQLGISWLVCAYCLWKCIFHNNTAVGIWSKGQDEADIMLERIAKMYKRLPPWMRELKDCPKLLKENASELEWSNGATVQSLPATQNSGSSRTFTIAVLDEFAKMVFAEQLFNAVKPTIDGGGQLIILSSAYGVGNAFHRLWLKAEKGMSDFVPLFLPWWSRPDRDAQWYRDMVRNHHKPEDVPQEYPSTSTESFLSSGRPRFDRAWINAQAKNVCEPLSPGVWSKPELWPEAMRERMEELLSIPRLRIYRTPQPGGRYALGGDPAEGGVAGDVSICTVIDLTTWEEMAVLAGKFDPDMFGLYLSRLGEFYNEAEAVVERNNHGHTVLSRLMALGYRRVVRGPDKRPGIQSNVQSKPQMVDTLAEALRDEVVQVHTQAALDEMAMYCIHDNGVTSAPSGQHDDYVSSWYLVIGYARRPRRSLTAY